MDALHYIFGIHIHQPVGNFDHVFRQHVEDVYLPLLRRLDECELLPAALHLSGPLLEWMQRHDSTFLDLTGRMVADGKLELLLSGYDEPILAALSREDRVEQIERMADALRRQFGVAGETLWLTERVWEPELPAELARAGVKGVLVDDRHFLVSGFRPETLHTHWQTEADGSVVTLFPIDQRLRYLVPFRPPEELADYLRELRARGAGMALLADDGEKFGGWPGTREWVWERGWMDRYVKTLTGLVDTGEVRMSTPSVVRRALPSGGLAYLPTASYHEMEGWSLPAESSRRLAVIEAELGEERLGGIDGTLIRGSHWRNFLVRYPESNRMHKKAMALSALCRERGNPTEARHAIGRAQCNDAYWHGVFGGLYLKHLRDAIWGNLAEAEELLRDGEPLSVEWVDVDGDGHAEIQVRSAAFCATVSPLRGGALEEYTVFRSRVNQAAVLTRRVEAYHLPPVHSGQGHERDGEGGREGMASIHDLERGLARDELPPMDREGRALFVDRVLPDGVTAEAFRGGHFTPIHSWGVTPLQAAFERVGEGKEAVVAITLDDPSKGFSKRYRFEAGGVVTVAYRWDPDRFPPDAHFAPELSIAGALAVRSEPEGVERWVFEVTTLSKSERGIDETPQGLSETFLFPVGLGQAELAITAGWRWGQKGE